jgi:hypothetical protein
VDRKNFSDSVIELHLAASVQFASNATFNYGSDTSHPWVVLTLLAFVCFMMNVVVHAADPDPLQDFCVADLSQNATHMNGYPCKVRSAVTAADFLFTGLRGPGTLYI